MKSTSVHHMSADQGLDRLQGYLWLTANRLNNAILPDMTGHALSKRRFVVNASESMWTRTDVKSSPSRKLSDLFWIQLPWDHIREELGEIRVFDAGCGTGGFGERLLVYSGESIQKYVGVDLVPQDGWAGIAARRHELHFLRLDSAEVGHSIPADTTLIISQSAIEHFEEDLTYFRGVDEFARRAGRSILQVHLFPSAACLRLYGHHGVRQYTPRTVASIARVFGPTSEAVLFKLGGDACNRLHWDFITAPTMQAGCADRRDIDAVEYDRRLRWAIAADNATPCRVPAFWALVIQTNARRMLFE